MPTRKQKRRHAKSKRHEYEFVYVDDEGNEVDAPPEEEQRHERRNGSKPTATPAKKAPPQRGARRAPQPPSWQRAAKRAVLLGAVVFVLFGVLGKSHNYASAAVFALAYTVLFIPFTFTIDRFAYRRWQQRQQQQSPTKR
jgi:hypothetical protein